MHITHPRDGWLVTLETDFITAAPERRRRNPPAGPRKIGVLTSAVTRQLAFGALMTSNRAGRTQNTSSTMANFIETIMHVLSFFCIFVIYGLYVMQDRLRPGMNLNDEYRGSLTRPREIVGFGDPASIVDIITISLIVGLESCAGTGAFA